MESRGRTEEKEDRQKGQRCGIRTGIVPDGEKKKT